MIPTPWAIQLVGGGAQEVDIQFIDIDGDVSECLNRVGVEWNSSFARDGSDFCKWLHGADFVVSMHDDIRIVLG